METDIDTILFKKIIRSQLFNVAYVADVMKLICKDNLTCKSIKGKLKAYKTVWFLKQEGGEHVAIDVKIAAKWVFDRVIPNYHRTAQFMFENAFDNNGMLMKPHYIMIGNRLLKVIDRLDELAIKVRLMLALAYEIIQ